ncbi:MULTISPECIES: MarR family winged helix-turn-helix transcriptional regulator [unclassified Crossiella]|uniref:MarR family winged helix-turn-helix transcriptional regulator n=1 Tax=unclassified Crossiella TaxID=2620835 RepID=UPI001FFEF6A1|nr:MULTISPECIES: MarR family transcriptional regulator [unclassified Crossiella]MCK2241930.1 MarR family transcriptional regulator [Crossiella sp. S99.2]MCK2255833.1 MarR family transcriptional regulator [Crossiella sp. S99.1]
MAGEQWLDERQHQAWRGFLAMQSRLLSHLARELQRQSGLSDADYAVLVGLSEAPDGRLRLHELGAELQWQKSRLSKQITRMQDRGLVQREECPTDGRGAFATLTGQGRATIEAAAPLHVDQVRRYFADVLTPAQLTALTEITGTVLDHLSAAEPPQQ